MYQFIPESLLLRRRVGNAPHQGDHVYVHEVEQRLQVEVFCISTTSLAQH